MDKTRGNYTPSSRPVTPKNPPPLEIDLKDSGEGQLLLDEEITEETVRKRYVCKEEGNNAIRRYDNTLTDNDQNTTGDKKTYVTR